MRIPIPRVEVLELDTDCKLCGTEMNTGNENYYRGLEICPRCDEEIRREKR